MIKQNSIPGTLIDLKHPYRILVVDPNRKMVAHLQKELGDRVQLDQASTGDTALQKLGLKNFDLAIIQLKLPLFSGIELIRELYRIRPDLSILAIIKDRIPETYAGISRLGYPPPLCINEDFTELRERCRDYIDSEEWRRLILELRQEMKTRHGFDKMLSLNPEVKQVYDSIGRIVNAKVPVLITGESGTGKELVARMIHTTGNKSKLPFVTVNCAAVPEGLLESQFFGHEKGAFTGATNRMPGKFELANNGMLFLDEIGEMSPALQAKILRVIEQNEFERVGGFETIKVNVRLITATNRNLEAEVESGNFRADLLYRINVFPIQLPPLRERGLDIILLAYHFLNVSGERNNRRVQCIHPDVLNLLQSYPWPGNVRELENAVERALLLSDGLVLRIEDFPQQVNWCSRHPKDTESEQDEIEYISETGIRPLKDIEKEVIQNALELTCGNIALTSRELGISRNTLYRKIEEHEITVQKNDDHEDESVESDDD